MYLTAKESQWISVQEDIKALSPKELLRIHYRLLRQYDIKFARVVLAQEVHETDWFSSNIYKENFNRFGMKTNSRDFDIGENRNHAVYPDFIASIKDYAAWQKRRLELNPWVKTEDDYIKMLVKVGYAEDKNYARHIKFRLKQISYLGELQ